MIRFYHYHLHPQQSVFDFTSIIKNNMLIPLEHVSLSGTTGYLIAEDSAALHFEQSLPSLIQDLDYSITFVISCGDTVLTQYLLAQTDILSSRQIWYDYEILLQLWKKDDLVCIRLLKQLFASLTREEIETLHLYMQCTFNGLKASEQLYIHRNTLQYRLAQIEDKTGIDFKEYHNAQLFFLYLAIAK